MMKTKLIPPPKSIITEIISRQLLLSILLSIMVMIIQDVSNVIAQQYAGDLQSEKNVLTVQDAIQMAYAKNPELNRLKLMASSAGYEKWIEWGLPPSRISFIKEGILTSTGKGFEEKRWTVSQTMDNPFKIYHRFRASQKWHQSVKSQQLETELEIRKRVKNAYADLAYSLQITELQKQVVDLIQDFYNTARIRYETGESTLMDVLKAEIDLAEARNELDEAGKEYHQKRYALFTVIGIEAEEQNYEIQFPDTLRYVDIPVNQDSALSHVFRAPAILSLTYLYESAIAQKKEAWSRFLPDIDFSVYIQNYGLGYNNHGFEFGFTFPLGFMLENRAQIALAGNKAKTLQWSWKEKELELKMNIENAWHQYDAVRRSLQRYEETIGHKSDQLYRLTAEAYSAGQSDILDLLEARRTFISSQRKYYGLLHDYYVCLIELEKFFEKDFVFVYGE